MKKFKKIFFTVVMAIFFILLSQTASNASSQKLNSLTYDAYINTDGSMYVIEEWDIKVSDTNTLFKNFKKDNSKFTTITDVTITDLTTGKQLTKIYEEMYHVTKDCYYALDISGNKFEIAWGVGLDDKTANKKYKIEYVVEDAITKYNDCSELYWQFIGEDFEINANSVSGIIHLSSMAKSKDEIKVWGHTEELNGEIYVTDLDKIEFNVDKFNSGNFVEVRIAFPNSIITTSGRIKNKNALQEILSEEEKWAANANAKRKLNEAMNFIIGLVVILIIVGIDVLFIFKIIKYMKLRKEHIKSHIKPTQEIKYFRDFPREDASPSEARFLLIKNKFSFYSTEIADIFSAILLDLYHLGYIDIQENKNDKDETKFVLKTDENMIDNLKNEDEIEVYKYLKKAAKDSNEITLKQLQKYITAHPSSVTTLQKSIEDSTKEKLYNMKYINKENEKQYSKYIASRALYIMCIFLAIFFAIIISIDSLIMIIPLVITLCLTIGCIVSLNSLMKLINTYSQEGIDEIEQWKGLKKFMEELSQIDKKEIPEVVLWEKYLIYATAFGIADKVLKQLKMVYPNFDEQVGISTSTHMSLILSSNISSTISKSMNSSISSAYSSGSGGGGGFSGGGRRRRRPADGGGGR